MSYDQLVQINQERKRRQELIYETVYERLKNRVMNAAKLGSTSCFYEVPSLIPGYPLINVENTMIYLYKKLTSEKFGCFPVSESTLFVIWNDFGTNGTSSEVGDFSDNLNNNSNNGASDDFLDTLVTAKKS
jgi:hypothetical protein